MGTPYLLFQREVTDSEVSSATNEAGLTPLAAIAASSNVGALTVTPSGIPTAALDVRLMLTKAGDVQTAEFKASLDGGTNYRGRRADSTWDGNGAAERVMLADTDTVRVSRPVLVDTDDDGIDDRVLVAIFRDSPATNVIDIYYTDDLDGDGSWTALAADVTTTAPSGPLALVRQEDTIHLLFITAGGLIAQQSSDNGATWGSETTVTAGSQTEPDACLLSSGKIAAVYRPVSANCEVNCKTSADGVTWSTAKQVTDGAAPAGGYVEPSIVQEADGKTIVFYNKAGTGINARQCTNTNPAGASATWAAYSETLWAADPNDETPSATIAPDGTIYVVWEDSKDLDYSKFKDGDSNYSASATALDLGDDVDYPAVANVGGALWCAYHNDTDDDANLVLTKYWGAYDAVNYPGAWTSTDAQYIGTGLWVEFGGSGGEVGDYWDIDSQYDYGKERCIQFRPSRPTRSTADEADWYLTFDMGANDVLEVDTIALMGNYETANFQMDDAATFNSDGGNPQVDTSISFVEETLASATWGADGTIYKASSGMAPREHAGKTVKAASTGSVYEISDNTADRLFVRGTDLSALTGEDAKILSDRKWVTQTATRKRYFRLKIPDQKTVAGYYETPLLVCGVRLALSARHKCIPPRSTQSVDEVVLPSGRALYYKLGSHRVIHNLVFTHLETAAYNELRAQLKYLDQSYVPFVLVPDSDVTTDFRLVRFPKEVEWKAVRFGIRLDEVI